MSLPRLRARAVSQQSCAAFRGISTSPTAPFGFWADERNLCSDMSPTAVARPARSTVRDIDGNRPEAPIVAMCGGDHPVLLEDTGRIWSGGNSLQLYPATAVHYSWTAKTNDVRAHVSAETGDSTDANAGPFGLLPWNGNPTVYELVYLGAEHPTHPFEWSCNVDGTTVYLYPEAMQPPLNWVGYDPDEILEEGGQPVITVSMERRYAAKMGQITMLRMGANVIIIPGRRFDALHGPKWANAVKLAAGQEMVQGTDYGDLNMRQAGNWLGLTLTMCDIDGNAYNGIVVSDTEPRDQEGYWLDSSGPEPRLREWSVSTRTWVVIASTFVRIHDDSYGWSDGLRQFDSVQMAFSLPEGTDPSVVSLLNSWHYLYKVDEGDLIVSGILPAGSVTLDPDEDHRSFEISRTVPEMDFVVEAGNRLWGCRYSDADSINEIYASALGDPTNWHVFQGLSTDSWTASRGRAAPFTGAAVLGGCPLFFREDCLEKVYPSTSGAHQILTFDLEGVEEGAADSLVVIEDRLFYKSRKGVMVYTGTMPARISGNLDGLEFRGGSAARHRRKYCLSTTLIRGSDEEAVVLVYDLKTGDWHMETDAWTGRAITWRDDLLYIESGALRSMAQADLLNYGRLGWFAETAPQAIHHDAATQSLTEHKWISYLRIRYKMLRSGSRMPNELRVYISYEGGDWQMLKTLRGGYSPRLHSWEINLLPRRMDNFRLRLEGRGPVQIYDIAWRMERSEGGH